MTDRLYIVYNRETDATSLVEAATPSQAVRLVTDEVFAVRTAKATEVANLMRKGARVITRPNGDLNFGVQAGGAAHV